MKKILLLSVALAGLALECNTANAGTADAGNTTGFTGGARLALTITRHKSKISVSKTGQQAALGQILVQTGAEGSEKLDAINLDSVVQATDAASTYATRIVARDYENNVVKYSKALANGIFGGESQTGIGIQAAAFAGFRCNNARFILGGLFEYQFNKREVTYSFSPEGTASKSEKSSDSKSDSSSSTSSSSKKSSKVVSVSEKKGPTFGFFAGVMFDLNNCFSIGLEGGLKRLKSEFDVSKANKELLGVNGVPSELPTGVSDKAIENWKRQDDLTTINNLTGKLWVPFLQGVFAFSINKYFSVFATAGYQWGGTYKLSNKDGGKEVKNPDYIATSNGGFIASIGGQVQF